MRPLKAGLFYFLLVFALGWVLGPIHEMPREAGLQRCHVHFLRNGLD